MLVTVKTKQTLLGNATHDLRLDKARMYINVGLTFLAVVVKSFLWYGCYFIGKLFWPILVSCLDPKPNTILLLIHMYVKLLNLCFYCFNRQSSMSRQYTYINLNVFAKKKFKWSVLLRDSLVKFWQAFFLTLVRILYMFICTYVHTVVVCRGLTYIQDLTEKPELQEVSWRGP
jgi:hypothetical protein